jgi:hypothetical protein
MEVGVDPGRRLRSLTVRRRRRAAVAVPHRRAPGARPRGSGNTSRVLNATRLRRSGLRFRRSGLRFRRSDIQLRHNDTRLQRSGIRRRRNVTRLQPSGTRLRRSGIRLRRNVTPHLAVPGAATAAVAPHPAIAAAAGRAAPAEAIAPAVALHTVAAVVDGLRLPDAQRRRLAHGCSIPTARTPRPSAGDHPANSLQTPRCGCHHRRCPHR